MIDRDPLARPQRSDAIAMEDLPQRQRARRYWKRVRALTFSLLAVWFVVTFVVSFFARDLNFKFFGWPFSYWMGAQGAPLIYALLTALYAWCMHRLDRRFALDQPDEEDDA